MEAPRIAVFGNHSCSNRGDAAIARGLLRFLENKWPDCDIDFYSRYPDAASYVLGRTAKADPLYRYYSSRRGVRTLGLLKLYLGKKYLATAKSLPMNAVTSRILSSREHSHFQERLGGYDLFVQVGGSFFVDLYGGVQFEAMAMALDAKVPVVLAGHSMGPFEEGLTKSLARRLLPRVGAIVLRESVSSKMLKDAGVMSPNITLGGDTAWLMPRSTGECIGDLASGSDDRPKIGLTVRDLAPFDRRLGVSQHEYEEAVSRLSDAAISAGYTVHAVSMCTGLDGYTHDDRMVALRIKRRVKQRKHFRVHMGEPTDIELGHFFSTCQFTIATRLHSAIVSMRFGTPAVALAYEHKAIGVLQKLGLPACAVDMRSFCDGREDSQILALIGGAEELRPIVADAAQEESALTQRVLFAALDRSLA